MHTPNFTILYVDQPLQSAALYQALTGATPVECSETFCLFVLANQFKLGLWSKHTVEPRSTTAGGSELAFICDSPTALADALQHTTSLGLAVVQGITIMDFGHTFVVNDPDGHRLRYYWPCEQA